jgi:Na+-driven multidrug efflux pump
MRWLSNGSEEIVHQAFLYLLPVLAGAITAVMFLLGCGILQAQGRTWLFAAAQIASFLLNGLLFDPLFLLGLKTEVWGGALATMLAELIPGVVLMYYVLSGRSGPHFDIHLFFQKFSPESYAALRAGFATLIMHLSTTIPAIFMQKYVALAAQEIGQFEDVMAIWNVLLRVYRLSICLVLALNTTFIPAVSYAFGRGEFFRILKLTGHVSWITFLWAIICEAVICLAPRQLGRIWSSRDSFLDWVERLLPKAFYAAVLAPAPYIGVAFLNSVKRPLLSSVLSIVTNLLPLPAFSTALYFTGKGDPGRVIYAYVIRDGFSFVIALGLIARPLWEIWRSGCENETYKTAPVTVEDKEHDPIA